MLLCCFLNTRKGEVTGRGMSSLSKPFAQSFQIEHLLHRSIWNFLLNLMAGLIAYTYLQEKPSLDLEPKALQALPLSVI